MEYGVMVEPQLGATYDELLASARWAEARGMVSFARSDHFSWMGGGGADATDAFASLAGLARETSSIRLAVLVSPLTFRHPAVIAKNAVTIDQMSGGRLDLGVGTGWMADEHAAFGLEFPDWSERFARLEEALPYLKAAFSPGHQTFDGDFYKLDVDARPKPTGRLPIIVGGSGPKRTPSLAGRFADEYNHFMAGTAVLAPKIEVVRASALQAGRDPDSILISLMGTVVTGRDEAEYRANLSAIAAFRDIQPDEVEREARSQGLPIGTRTEVEAALEPLAELGVSRLYLQHFEPILPEALDRAFGALLD